MPYTDDVQDLIDSPLGGRTPDEVRILCSGSFAQHALAHEPDELLLARYARLKGVSVERAAMIFLETKRFLVVGRLVGAHLAPSPEVDEMWHQWILYTMDYTDFCEKLGGYVHHKPIPTGSPEQPPLDPTISLLEAAYGPVDETIWPVALGARGIMDCKKGA
jgi:hypothetical protein